VSTSAVDTWRAVKIRTENLTEVPNGFLPLIQVPPMIPNKTEVLNLKTRKTQVPMGYLSLNFKYFKVISLFAYLGQLWVFLFFIYYFISS
jgi:hypothetical protein